MDLISPFPLPAEDEPRRPELHQELVKELFKRSRSALVLLALLLPLLWQVLGDATFMDPRVPWIFGILVVNIVARLLLLFFMERLPEPWQGPAALHLQYLLGSTMAGLCFGALNLAAIPHLDPLRICLLAVCHTGINAFA